MKFYIKLIFLFVSFFVTTVGAKVYKVTNIIEFNNSLKTVMSGDCIEMANANWTDVQLVFKARGTEKRHIKLKAETPGKVIIIGVSNLSISGEYLDIEGLVFKNGYTPTKTVILFKTSEKEYANHCGVYNCVIDNFNQPIRETEDNWISMWGKNNEVSNCYIAGKTNLGTTFIVCPDDERSIENNHIIRNNYFGPRLRLGSNTGETLRVGTSHVCTNSSQTKIWNNYFDRCSGEVEIVSIKSSDNNISNNTFYECEGSVVLRHGDRNTVKGNWFIGNDKPFTGGVRIINEGHIVTDNYFYKLRGDEFRSPLTVMNGIPNSPASGYAPVRNVLFANNTFNECALPWNFCVGVSERNRIVAPQNTWVVNNLVYSPDQNEVIKTFDSTDGFIFQNNLLISKKGTLNDAGNIEGSVQNACSKDIKTINTNAKAELIVVDKSNKINTKLIKPFVGAFKKSILKANKMPATANNCGPRWYKLENDSRKKITSVQTINVTAGKNNLGDAINKANAGDILLLDAGTHILKNKILLTKSLTISSSANSNAILKMQAASLNESMFEFSSDVKLTVENIKIDGNNGNLSPKFAFFAPDQSVRFSLFINNCDISGFNVNEGSVFSSSYCSMADSVVISNSKIHECIAGINLHKELEDGKYNAEKVILSNSVFSNITDYAIDFYRGGNDESTIGGSLELNHCVFDKVGKADSKAILKLSRIMYVKISNSIFTNSQAKSSFLLWYLYNNVSNSCFYNCAKPEFVKGASSSELIFANPGFEGDSYRLSENSILKGKGTVGKNIGIQ